MRKHQLQEVGKESNRGERARVLRMEGGPRGDVKRGPSVSGTSETGEAL